MRAATKASCRSELAQLSTWPRASSAAGPTSSASAAVRSRLRGPGETQLETDRRLLQKRVEQLQKRLDKVDVQHTQMRRARVRSELPRVALVGYTNAGKSTLFNALTGADAYADDRLFATLDPTVRRIALPSGTAMLADTVGFVRDLPHELCRGLRATLAEAREADLLLHVVDAADPLRDDRIAQVMRCCRTSAPATSRSCSCSTRIDRVDERIPAPRPARPWRRGCRHGRRRARTRLAVGARWRWRAAAARCARIRLGLRRIHAELQLPASSGRLRAQLHELGAVRAKAMTSMVGTCGWTSPKRMPSGSPRRPTAPPLQALLPEPADGIA